MAKEYPILLAVHPLSFIGARLLGNRWGELVEDLRRGLRAAGVEAPDSNSDLLLVNYENPLAAVTSLFEQLDRLRKKFGWEGEKVPLPLQYILHLEKKNELPPNFRAADAPAWEGLAHETVYLSRALKLQWEQLVAGRPEIPAHQLQDDETGLVRLHFSNPAALRRKRLFPYRHLLVEPGRPVCFYCGMTGHPSAKCPSKLLTMDSLGITELGYQSLEMIGPNFKAAFADLRKMVALLGPGVELAQIRKDPVLQTFIAFFDSLIVYQPRYLWYLAFSIHPVWSGISQLQKIKLDSRNLQSGLDCLRVGQYEQARELLLAENQALGGKQFYATVGLAFVALERGRPEEMGHQLQLAVGLAEVEKEKIYVSLLLSRYHDIIGHVWKADHAIQAVANLFVDCHEVIYRRIQIAVKKGQGANVIKALGKLVEMNRLYFMIVLMDPVLLPIEGLVEDLLAAYPRAARAQAEEILAETKKEYERLRKWFDGDDKDFNSNLDALINIDKQMERGSYYDLVDVIKRARILRQSGPRLQESKIDQLNEQIDQAVLTWEQYQELWNHYPYQSFWRSFEALLRRTRRQLVESRTLAADSLSRGTKRLEAAKAGLKEVGPVLERMKKLRLALDTMKVFGGRLVMAELVMAGVLLVAYPVLTMLLAEQLGPELAALVRDPAAQKRSVFVAGALVAPMVAFAQTIKRMAK